MKRLPLLLSLVLATPALAASPNADATAKFLAGLPVKGTPLAKQAANPDWTAYAGDFERDWKRFDEEQLTKIRAWAAESLGPSFEDRGPLYYMFSGPDFLYAHAFFPNAGTYILSGIEPVGSMPDIGKIPRDALPSSLVNLRKSLDSVFGRGYFITKYMMADLKHTSSTARCQSSTFFSRAPAAPLIPSRWLRSIPPANWSSRARRRRRA